MTLDQININKTVQINQINGGWHMRQKLNQMGIHVGDKLFVKRTVGNQGPILVEVHRTEVALGRGMAKKIDVSE